MVPTLVLITAVTCLAVHNVIGLPSLITEDEEMLKPNQHDEFMAMRRRRFERDSSCPSFEPFRCPQEEKCISIQYLCDGAADCINGYDEDAFLCTAARRPPVEETTSFLQSLLNTHGSNYLESLFGAKARNNLELMGGVQNVAIVLSESHTIDDFARALHLNPQDVRNLKMIFNSVEQGDLGILSAIGIKDSEIGDMKFFFEKLINTGFLD
eukprot:TRINITY_DN8075_c0_g1_i1.p1 TRINITY_DN8075_c0_g1~~TRINITY_DN8075_c0_g1_i1.p1  ORF type:complete len:211 (-),score=24.45 TRINITY_DN8075_c0_g1_i1:361-993(-)